MSKGMKALKKRVWSEFSKVVRMADADENGYCTCFTCGCRKHYKEMQCGHMVAGRTNSILFDESCRVQCYACNCCKNGNQGIFVLKMVDEMGRDYVDDVFRRSKKTKKFTEDELKELLETFKDQVTVLRSTIA